MGLVAIAIEIAIGMASVQTSSVGRSGINSLLGIFLAHPPMGGTTGVAVPSRPPRLLWDILIYKLMRNPMSLPPSLSPLADDEAHASLYHCDASLVRVFET